MPSKVKILSNQCLQVARYSTVCEFDDGYHRRARGTRVDLYGSIVQENCPILHLRFCPSSNRWRQTRDFAAKSTSGWKTVPEAIGKENPPKPLNCWTPGNCPKMIWWNSGNIKRKSTSCDAASSNSLRRKVRCSNRICIFQAFGIACRLDHPPPS